MQLHDLLKRRINPATEDTLKSIESKVAAGATNQSINDLLAAFEAITGIVSTEATLAQMALLIDNIFNKQTDGAQKTQTVDPAGISLITLPRVFDLTITRPANTNAYAAGDVIGDVSAALSKFVDVAKAAGYGVIITNVRLQTNDTGFAGKAMNLHVYKDAVDPIADNEPFVLSDANAPKRRGVIPVTFGTGDLSKVAQDHFQNLIVCPVSRDIPVILQAAAAVTPSANSTWIRIEIGCLLCN